MKKTLLGVSLAAAWLERGRERENDLRQTFLYQRDATCIKY
jgi:hypothetical protein